jgi:hypothetical protein
MSSYESSGEILYSTVSKSTKLLAQFTNSTVEYGNFPRASLKLLEKIPSKNGRNIINYEKFFFLIF